MPRAPEKRLILYKERTTRSQPTTAQSHVCGSLDDRITFLGHATALIELGGMRVLTDPVLRQQVGPLWRRVPRPSTEHLQNLDLILLSHLHLDHCDPASLRLLGRGIPIVGPPGSAKLLRVHGFTDVHEIKAGEALQLGCLSITATDALHNGARYFMGDGKLSNGYVVSAGGEQVYFAGDTGLFPGMEDFASLVDVALLPIAGLGPRLPEYKHMSPRHAVRAMELLQPRLVIPIHWGTYHLPGTALLRMRPDVHRRAPHVFLQEAELHHPSIKTVLLNPGSGVYLADAAQTPGELPPPVFSFANAPSDDALFGLGGVMRRARLALEEGRS